MTVNWDAVAGADSYDVERGADKRLEKIVTKGEYSTDGVMPDAK
ncbi:hypothetical protein [Bacillus amyloliquefaciens]|nr:hypothetical protein [Bacillus amyloliquefaciens]